MVWVTDARSLNHERTMTLDHILLYIFLFGCLSLCLLAVSLLDEMDSLLVSDILSSSEKLVYTVAFALVGTIMFVPSSVLLIFFTVDALYSSGTTISRTCLAQTNVTESKSRLVQFLYWKR